MRLVCASPAESAKQRILAVNHIVRANIKIIPVFDYFCGVSVVVEQAPTGTILRMGAVWFRKDIQIFLPDGVDSRCRNHVGLRTGPHELQSGGGVENLNWIGNASVRGAGGRSPAQQFGKVTCSH